MKRFVHKCFNELKKQFSILIAHIFVRNFAFLKDQKMAEFTFGTKMLIKLFKKIFE